jgi:hypothetical protein
MAKMCVLHYSFGKKMKKKVFLRQPGMTVSALSNETKNAFE